MQGRRHIQSTIGHRTTFDILPGADGIRLYRSDANIADAMVLSRFATQILSAYLASVIAIGVEANVIEDVEDEYETVLSAHNDPAPLVRIRQQDRVMDIHAPSWESLRCQINLVIPRLTDEPAPPQIRLAAH